MPSDKERLDWLEKSNPHLDASCIGIRVYLEAEGSIHRTRTIRQAIDAAIRSSKARGGK